MIDLKDLQLLEVTHAYYYKNRRLVGVNETFDRTGLSDFSKIKWEVLEASKIKGEYVHELARLVAIGRLKPGSVDHRLTGYLSAIKQFFKQNVKKVISTETPICDPYFGYAGTPDLVYLNFKNRICLPDFKTPENKHPVWPLQTAAYKNAWDKCFPKKKIWQREGVMLHENGDYTDSLDREVYKDPQDFDNFLAALRVTQFKINHHINS